MEEFFPNYSMIYIVLTAAIGLIAVLCLAIASHLFWAWRYIHHLPHVETASIAIPEISPYLETLIGAVATAAQVKTPRLYIIRSQLPNAFVIASMMRPELFLTDELLEEANNQHDKVGYLLQIFCHEIAHLKNSDSIRLGLLQYIINISNHLQIKTTELWCDRHIIEIERQADLTAEALLPQAIAILDNRVSLDEPCRATFYF